MSETKKTAVRQAVTVDPSLWKRCRKKAKEQGIVWNKWVMEALRVALNGDGK